MTPAREVRSMGLGNNADLKFEDFFFSAMPRKLARPMLYCCDCMPVCPTDNLMKVILYWLLMIELISFVLLLVMLPPQRVPLPSPPLWNFCAMASVTATMASNAFRFAWSCILALASSLFSNATSAASPPLAVPTAAWLCNIHACL